MKWDGWKGTDELCKKTSYRRQKISVGTKDMTVLIVQVILVQTYRRQKTIKIGISNST